MFNIDSLISGLHTLTQELSYGIKYGGMSWSYRQKESREHLYQVLQQLFPIIADVRVEEVKSLTESYHKYKSEFVKHLSFNLEQENLSKCFLPHSTMLI